MRIEIGVEVAQRIREKGESMTSVEEVAQYALTLQLNPLLTIRRELHERLLLRNEQTKQVHLPEVYMQLDSAKENVATWMNSRVISDAVPKLVPVGIFWSVPLLC